MGRLILILVGVFLAVMVLLWVVHAVMAFVWIALILALGLAVLRVVFWAGRKSRR
jgi:uncharacterized Tic20 family protein